MLPASKTIFCAYLLVHGVTPAAKSILDKNYEGIWTFMKEELSFKFIEKIIALQKPHEGSQTVVEKIYEDADMKDFKPVSIVEIINDWVKKMVKK